MNMPTFDDVRVFDHKGVKGADLLGLGKINVVCGPNNSGKTSVLECLCERGHNYIGRRFAAADTPPIEQIYLHGGSWRQPHFGTNFRAAVTQVLTSREVWFENEVPKIQSDVVAALSTHHVGLDNPPNFIRALTTCFGPRPTVVLVSAKRRLDAQIEVNSSQQVGSDGAGVLNYLFAAKNAESGSTNRHHFETIFAAFKAITEECTFDITLNDKNLLNLRFQRRTGSWLHADDCGLGFRELLIVLYFGIASPHDVVLIEEPENHQHPDIQRKLVAYLRDKTQRQFFLSTHSSVFSNTLYADRVFTCKLADRVSVDNVTSRAALLASLGYAVSDNLVSDLVILVEGPTDKLILEEFFRKLGVVGEYVIRIWPLGGDIMSQLDLTVFVEAYRLLALIDLDPHSKKVRDAFRTKCVAHGIPLFQLKRYAIENYLSLPCIEKVMHQKAPAGLAGLDPKKRVSDQLGFDIKKNAAQIAREMSLQDIDGTDLHEFLLLAAEKLAHPQTMKPA